MSVLLVGVVSITHVRERSSDKPGLWSVFNSHYCSTYKLYKLLNAHITHFDPTV